MDSHTEKEIADVIDRVTVLAQVYAPQFAAYILLGSAIAKLTPELYGHAVALLSKPAPTPEEKAELTRKLHALANPELVES